MQPLRWVPNAFDRAALKPYLSLPSAMLGSCAEPAALRQEPVPSIDVPVRDLADFEWENPRVPPPPLQFDDAKAAFAAHSSLSIMRSLAVFSLCSIKVRNLSEARLQ